MEGALTPRVDVHKRWISDVFLLHIPHDDSVMASRHLSLTRTAKHPYRYVLAIRIRYLKLKGNMLSWPENPAGKRPETVLISRKRRLDLVAERIHRRFNTRKVVVVV